MAADGQISIDITVDGTQVTAANTALGTLATSAQSAGGQTDALGQQTTKASMSIKDMAVSLGLVAVGAKAFSILKSSLDSAISRFDTLVGFPRIMEQMGFSSEQATKSLSKMSDGIQGLPTTLDGIVKSTQNIAILTRDLDLATDTALSLNNAFLASGSSSADAERGLTQYVQMLSKGSVDMMSWRTLQETMGYALNETAKAFGFAGKSAQKDLYAALKDGDITFDAFNAKIIELNGGVGGFAEVAKTSSAGIATSMQNLKNAVTVGVANMIVSFDNLSKATTGKSIAENMDGLKVVVKAAFTVIGKAIEGAAPIVTVFASAVSASVPVVKALTPAIVGLMAAYATYTVVSKAAIAIEAAKSAILTAQAASRTLTVITAAQTTAQMLGTTATYADISARLAQSATISVNTALIGLMTGKITLSTAAQIVATAATHAWNVAVKLLLGPVGWITAAIGLLVAGVIILVKWFNKSTEEGERLGGVTDALAESTKALNDSLEGSSSAYERNIGNIESTAHANTDLISKIEELLAVEDKSGAQKKELESYVDSLNGSVEGLSLAYSKEANSLNLSSEEIANKIALMKEQETLTASQERFLEISKSQSEVDMKLVETNALRQEWNEKLEDGSVKSKEYKTAIAELDEQETQLTGTIADLGAQQLDTEKQITASIEAVAKATKESITDQVLAYEFLEDSQKDVVDSLKSTWEDYKKQATDMFDKLSEKSKTTVSEMTKNLEENQRVMTNWSENIATLAKRGIDEGLLDTLRSAGPESAGHVKALVNSSDAELMKLSDAFAKGGDVATSALSKSLGDNSAEVLDKVGHMVTQSGATLTQQIEKADFASLGKAMPEGTAKGVEEGTKEVTDATRKMAEDAEKEFRNSLEIKSPSGVFRKDGVHITEGVTQGVESGIPKVVSTMTKLYKAMIVPFANISTDFQKIGTFAGDGLVTGLNNSEGRVMATARGLANNVAATMRSALDTHSPSKVTTKIGVDTGTGLSVGIESTTGINKKAVDKVGEIIKAATEKNVAEVLKIGEVAEKKRTEIQEDYAKKRSELSRKSGQSIQSAISAQKTKKGNAIVVGERRIQTLRADASAKHLKLVEDENKKLATINDKAMADIVKKESELSKAKLETVKNYVADKKSLDEMSLADEINIWGKSLVLFEKGSKERVEIQKNHQAALTTLNDNILKVNEEYAGKMSVINEKLRNEEQKLTDEYTKSVEGRTSALSNFMGLFDAYEYKFEQTGRELTTNLESQVKALERWSGLFEQLSEKAIDEGLLEELRQMGPKALPQLVALNSMTESELLKYSDLYKEKSKIAREQSERELAPMKANTENLIAEVRRIAHVQLTELEREWIAKMKTVTRETDKELKTLELIGENAGRGLLNGLASMQDSIVAKATEIANAVAKAMEKALDINSPSRRLFAIGEFTGVGFEDGLESRMKSIMKLGKLMAETAIQPVPMHKIPSYSPSISGGRTGGNNNKVGGIASENHSSSSHDIDRSRVMHNQVTIQSKDDKADFERMLRRLAFEFRL